MNNELKSLSVISALSAITAAIMRLERNNCVRMEIEGLAAYRESSERHSRTAL